MEAAEPIQIESQTTILNDLPIDFIEESIIKKERENFKIQFGIKGQDLIMKAIQENSKDIFYYQQIYNINELQILSKVFLLYETVKEIIIFLKGLVFNMEEKNDNLILRFSVYMPDGENKPIELNLKKCSPDNNALNK